MTYGPKPWLQRHWDLRAATNFILGGTGSGLLVAAALTAQAAPGWRPFVALGLALVALGLGAVWLEIGRKLRALHVFFNPFTSWMTRESFAALVVFALGAAALALGQPWTAQALGLAALAFVYCQGRILRASKGIPAWRTAGITPLIMATGLAEGSGLYLIATGGGGGVLGPLALFVLALVARALAWRNYRANLGAGRPLSALEASAKWLLNAGTATPLALVLLAHFVLPQLFPAGAVLAGMLALSTGWYFKFTLVTRAAFNQGFALPRLPVRGSR
jgi:phenylacetyl-CoA:acceptor oxidoreductase subunit 2